MPLCNGVRPLYEDMPSRDGGGNVELFTSNTTAPILSMLNQVTAEPEVARDDLENSLMRNGVLSALGRKQLLNAVYGKEPDPNDKHDQRTGFTGKNADKDRFFRQHLGNKVLRGWAPGRRVKKGAGIHYENEGNSKAYVYADIEMEDDAKHTPMLGQAPAIGKEPTPAWMGAELKRVGNFDPNSPDKRGKWKMVPLDGIELKTGHEPTRPYSPGAPGSPAARDTGGRKLALGGEAPKPVRIDQMMTELRIRPSHAMSVIREVLRVVFEVAAIRIHKFHFSLGELVGLAKHDQTFSIPYHTRHEKQHMAALQSLCAKHLELLGKSHSKEDFDGIASFPAWKKEYRDLMERVMQSMPAWQLSAVLIFWNLNRKMVALRDENEDTRRGKNSFHNRKTPKDFKVFCTTALTTNEAYVQLEQEVVEQKLDFEWYDRLCLVHKRDRRYLREELGLYFENALLRRKQEAAPALVEQQAMLPIVTHVAHHQQQQHTESTKDDVSKQATASETPTADGNAKVAAMAIEAAPAAVLEERKPKPLEGITAAELVDMPQYWYDDRLANGDGGLVDTLTLKAGKALKAMMFDTEEFTFEAKGKKKARGEEVWTSKMLAYKLLNRKRGNMSSNNSLEFVTLVQKGGQGCEASGIVPGRIVDDDLLMGASRGACSYRLVPSYPQHDHKATQHPLSRPPSAKIKSVQQFFDIQKVLKQPSVDGRGKSLKLHAPTNISRPPTATPKTQRFRRLLQKARSSGTGLERKTPSDRDRKAPSPRSLDANSPNFAGSVPVSVDRLSGASGYDSDRPESFSNLSRPESMQSSPSPSHESEGADAQREEEGARGGERAVLASSARVSPASPSIHRIAAPPLPAAALVI